MIHRHRRQRTWFRCSRRRTTSSLVRSTTKIETKRYARRHELWICKLAFPVSHIHCLPSSQSPRRPMINPCGWRTGGGTRLVRPRTDNRIPRGVGDWIKDIPRHPKAHKATARAPLTTGTALRRPSLQIRCNVGVSRSSQSPSNPTCLHKSLLSVVASFIPFCANRSYHPSCPSFASSQIA